MQQRRGGGLRGQGSGQQQVKTRSAKNAALPAPQSAWQTGPPDLIAVLQRLLEMDKGDRHVRVASHVCSFWRHTAQEVLLADTAISKPPLEDFRAIGVRQPQAQTAKAAKADTVATQAAVVMEATASSGMEANSKQRFDAPHTSVAIALAGRHRLSSRRRSNAAVQPRAQQPGQPIPVVVQLAAMAEPDQDRLLAAARPAAAVPAAASPNRQQRRVQPAAPQGSVQSGRSMGYGTTSAGTESESEGGSTHAQLGAAAGTQRQQSPRRTRSDTRAGSVEKPQPQPQPRRQHQQAKAKPQRQQAKPQRRAAAADPGPGTSTPGSLQAGPSGAATRTVRKRMAASAAAVEQQAQPSKRQRPGKQAAQPQRQQHLLEQEPKSEQPQLQEPAPAAKLALPACAAQQFAQLPVAGTRSSDKRTGQVEQQPQQPEVAVAAGVGGCHPTQQQQPQAPAAAAVPAPAAAAAAAAPCQRVKPAPLRREWWELPDMPGMEIDQGVEEAPDGQPAQCEGAVAAQQGGLHQYLYNLKRFIGL